MQDFANYGTDIDLEASRANSTAWSADIPSLIFGVLLGVASSIGKMLGFTMNEY
jgi:hypothetical protein